jgi:hypothetical protein
MKFSRVVDLILEESKPKYELISPEDYSRVYAEGRAYYVTNGFIKEVIETGIIGNTRQIDVKSKEAAMIRKKWKPAVFLSGFEIVTHLEGGKFKSDIKKYNIVNDVEMMYIVNDTTGVDYHLDQISWNHWLEPTVTYKDYTSQETIDAFDRMIRGL